ncbi:MAG: DUF3782 domain-containing protein [Candidatus Thermofonsia Clade 3 bacterium]|uniref:DUF3782 domain-containing protein n=1 Tax=Candidatus Thermofonsia Clade 3 bacterium TaxID=2364212 RepID=A0A2M8Q953_9CHLR|nr:MAG: DUF3782 domain-containing protein [Candidatus Thermofonsia Clade 3 bacterium]
MIASLAEQSKETDRRMQETDRRMQETDRLIRELRESGQETDRRMQETERYIRETSREVRELKKQIGGLGDKFGYFAEGMALPTMERLLRRRFGMTNVAPRHRVREDGREREYDVLAWANGKVNRVVVVEVKSRVKREAIGQLIEQVETLFDFVPELKGKARIGILSGIDWDVGVMEEAQAAALYTATIRDDLFTLTTPKQFKPRVW